MLTGTYPLSYTFPTDLREGRYTFLLQVDGQFYEYRVDVRGWKVTTRHIILDRPRYAPDDEITAVAEFWNEGDAPINDLRLTAWVFTPDGGDVLTLTPAVSRTVDLQPGLNVLTVSGRLATPVVGPHRLLINLGQPGWRVAGAAAQFDVGWAHLVELTTDRGNYAPGEPGTGRLDLYGFGPTQLLITATDGSTLLETEADLSGFTTFTFPIPTTEIDDYLLVAQSMDQNGSSDQLMRAYAVSGPRDNQPPVITLTHPNTITVITTSAPTTTLTVTGQATDDGGQVVVLVNGQVVTPTTGGAFSLPLEMVQGVNLVSAVARDPAGNLGFSPIIPVVVMPERGISLTANQHEVGVGQPLVYTAVLTASGTISDVVVSDLLPAGSFTNVSASATSGQVGVSPLGVTWSGDVTEAEPVVITVQLTPQATGLLTTTATVYWGYGVIETSNDVTVEVVEFVPVSCELYPIAVHANSLNGVVPGDVINVFNGKQSGQFGWLTWTGDNGIPALANSLTPPGDSNTYVNPNDPDDHTLSVGDWVYGRPGVGNSRQVRDALDLLMQEESIILPVWDQTTTNGSSGQYHTSGFVQVRLLAYALSGPHNHITVEYLGDVTCNN